MNRFVKPLVVITAAAWILCLTGAQALCHPGGLNSQGCHTNRKTGDHHCHDPAREPAQTVNSFVGGSRNEPPQLTITIPNRARTSKPQPVRVVGVVDGDTIKVILNGTETNIRLHGIDAPESGQAYGQAATKVMREITTGRPISINVLDQDRYGRPVALVYADGVSAQEVMLELGYAWVYTKYCSQPYCSQWAQLQDRARQQKKGLWEDKNAQPPWEWRHGGTATRSDGRPAMQGLMSSGSDNNPNQASQAAATGGRYSGNVGSFKFHAPGCRHYNCRNCTAKFSSREQAIESGYSPCGMCKP